MGRLLDNNFTDAPTMMLSPKQESRNLPHLTQNPFAVPSSDSSPFSALNPSCPRAFASGTTLLPSGPPKSCFMTLPTASTTPLFSNPKRKRSHSQFADAEENAPAAPPVVQPREEPIYGEGMTLINPRTGMSISAESQSGTWLEEKMEAATNAAAPIAVPTLGSGFQTRKYQRLDATASGYDDITAAAIRRKIQDSTQEDRYRTPYPRSPSSSSSMEEPQVDSFTQMLGISWQRISTDDKDMAAAVRGWEKYINNHYSRYIQDSQILLKHKGLNAYLVTSRSSSDTSTSNHFGGKDVSENLFYLFNEDLTEARLVASDWQTCAKRLRCSPIEFAEGSEVIRAEHAQRTDAGAAAIAQDAEMKSGGLGLDMTMDVDS